MTGNIILIAIEILAIINLVVSHVSEFVSPVSATIATNPKTVPA